MAVTRDGTPIRCWTFPGNENDTAIIGKVKDDLAGWNLHRMVWVADRGFASAANRAYLTRGGGHYIHAEKLRHTNTEAAAALARPGRYVSVAGNLRVKEIHVAPGGKGDGDHGVVLGVPEGDCRGGLAAADGADSVPVSPVDRDGRGVVVQLGCVYCELTDRAEHDRGQQAGPVGVEQRFQGPPDPVVVEPVDLGCGQPQQAWVVAGGPLAQPVQGFAAQHQVGHHQPNRGRWSQLDAGVPGRQHARKQRGQPEAVQDMVDDRQPAQGAGDQGEVAFLVRLAHHDTPYCGVLACITVNAILRLSTEGYDTLKESFPMPHRPPEAPGPRFTAQLTGLDYALPGTLARRFMRCGKTNCRCKADPPTLHGPYLHWTRTVAGKTVTRSLTPDQARRYQAWFDNARRLRDLLNELEARSLRAFEDAEG